MTRGLLRISLVLAVGLGLVLTSVPPVGAASPTYLTTGIVQSGVKQTIIGNYQGVLVNYTNTQPTSVSAFVYLDLVNSAGQTVYWNLGTCTFGASQKVKCFIAISGTISRGTYTAWVFATTDTEVPVSTSTSVRVTM